MSVGDTVPLSQPAMFSVEGASQWCRSTSQGPNREVYDLNVVYLTVMVLKAYDLNGVYVIVAVLMRDW